MTMSDVSHTQNPENVDTGEQKTTDREPSVAKTTSTAVDHPAHYNHGGAECIDVARGMPFCLGNALKYVGAADTNTTARSKERGTKPLKTRKRPSGI